MRRRVGAPLGALLGLTGGLLLGGDFRPLIEPPHPIEARVAAVDYWAGSRGSDELRFKLQDGRLLFWSCRSRNCRNRVAALKALRWETPATMHFEVTGDRIIGLTWKSIELINVDLEQQRQLINSLVSAVILASLGALGGYSLATKRPRRRPANALVEGTD